MKLTPEEMKEMPLKELREIEVNCEKCGDSFIPKDHDDKLCNDCQEDLRTKARELTEDR